MTDTNAGGGFKIKPSVKGTLRPIGNRVIVSDMYFGDQLTKGGLIITSDDGKTRGIYPRWAKVHAKGPENNDQYNVGDWILVEHGRWTRSINVDEGRGEIELRMVEAESILMWSSQKPEDVVIGKEYSDGQSASFDPSTFVRT
jgi:co-chaperonin GroES (HSP10)